MSGPSRSSGLVRFGRFEFDPETGDLWKSGRHVRLPDQPRQVLRVLVARPGELVSRDELRRALWPDDTFVDFDTGLNVVVNRIRQTLDDSASAPRFIETLARRGYRFIAPIAVPATPIGTTATSDSSIVADPAQVSIPSPRRRVTSTATIAMLVLAAALAIAGGVVWRRAQTSASVPPIRSIAVLPLRNVSPDPKEAWFAEGMTDAVISDLARISALRVISRQSTARFQNSPESMNAVSRALGADAVIEGSVGLVAGRVRLSIRLVHGATDRQLWSGTYERNLSDVLALQGELAQAVADATRITITGEEQSALAGRRPVDPEAYALYLRAIHLFGLRGESVRKSIGYFQQAIARDPSFAAAYGAMALANIQAFIETVPPEEAFRPARAAATRALALEPTQVDGLIAMNNIAFYGDRNLRAAKLGMERVVQLYPNNATARSTYGSLLTEVGPLEDALAQRRRALELDPLANATNNSLGAVLTQMGRYAEAVTAFKNALELDPGYADAHGWLGFAYLKMGRRDEGIAELEGCAQLSHNQVRMVARLAHVYGLVGRQADGQRLLTTLIDRSHTEWVSPMFLAHAYAGLGDFDRAFAHLEEAYKQGTPTLIRLKSDPMLDPLKGDPRFADLVRRLTLPWP